MRIMIDTSVWIDCREDEEFRSVVETIAGKNEVGSSEVIEKELGKATEFLHKRNAKDFELPKNLHNKFRKSVVKTTNSVQNSVEFILTLNRRTLASDTMKAVYTLVNNKRNLKTPQFLTAKESIRRFSYA